uniref:Band 7 domain-containing protein n=1 Tax=Magallana gigas TaxID=29159 RepID=A0A8W8KLI5_MAGGI
MGKKKYIIGSCVVVVILMIVVLISTSYHKLASDEIGLQYDVINKKLGSSAEREGLHNGPPGFEFIVFPSVFRSLEFSLKCLNKDGVEIKLDVTYQYKVRAVNLRTVILDFRNFTGYKKVLTFAGEAALHEACSYFNTSQFQSQRAEFQEFVRKKLIERYNILYADITDLQVSNIERPPEYESAIRSKERAREDIQVALNERPRLLTEAETAKREAETQAEIIKNKAESDARILTNKAKTEASGILLQYEKEAESYQRILGNSGLNLTTEESGQVVLHLTWNDAASCIALIFVVVVVVGGGE